MHTVGGKKGQLNDIDCCIETCIVKIALVTPTIFYRNFRTKNSSHKETRGFNTTAD